MGTAKPMPMNVPALVGLAKATTIPTVWPLALTSGPPELPGFTAASNWMSPVRLVPSEPRSPRSSPDTTPVVVLRVSPSGLPMATTGSPTFNRPALPITAGTTMDGRVVGPSVAMSVVGSALAMTAGDVVPSAKVTRMAAASFTTCRAVMMVPSALTMTPVPESPVVLSLCTASMATTEGATFV
jgi:hypothetical protein